MTIDKVTEAQISHSYLRSPSISRTQEKLPEISEANTTDQAAIIPAKRALDAGPEDDTAPLKKPRLPDPETLKSLETETSQPILYQPQPKRLSGPRKDLQGLLGPVPSLDPLDTFVFKWLQSLGTDRERLSRSDSHLDHLRDDPIPRKWTRSAPEMDYRRDADGFAVPPTPGSSNARSRVAGSARGSSRPSNAGSSASARISVEDPNYRDILEMNNIHLRPTREGLPDHVGTLVEKMRRDRDSPGPSAEEIFSDPLIEDVFSGPSESLVEEYYTTTVFPRSSDIIHGSRRMLMNKSNVPSSNDRSVPMYSTPAPDILYGYNRRNAFPDSGQRLHLMQADHITRGTNESNSLIYPFFVVELKGVSGNMWVAANQCLGGAATCINIAEGLNRQLREYQSEEVQPVDSSAFSIAMNGSFAKLYVSWKHDELNYYTRNVESYLLERASDYIEFRKTVRNIVDWGKNERLKDIQRSLDIIIEAARKRTSEEAKSRQAPGDSSQGQAKKARSSSSSMGGSSRGY